MTELPELEWDRIWEIQKRYDSVGEELGLRMNSQWLTSSFEDHEAIMAVLDSQDAAKRIIDLRHKCHPWIEKDS